jgi:HEAT repeat protein
MGTRKKAAKPGFDLDQLLGRDSASRAASLKQLEADDPELAVHAAALCLPGCWDQVLGPRACQVLSRSGRDEALDALLTKAYEDRNYPFWWDPARDALANSVHLRATDRLIEAFEQRIAPFRTSPEPDNAWIQWRILGHLANVLASRPDWKRVVPRLTELATTPSLFPGPCGPEVRKAAVHALAERGTDSPEVWTTLIGLSRGGEPEVRKAVALTLGRRVKDSASIMDAVIGMLRDGDREVRETVIHALENAGPAAVRAIPDLLAHLEALITDRHWRAQWERTKVIDALENIGPGDARVAQVLLECVREK